MQARKLEGELDMKLAAYGKLCSGYEYGGYGKGEAGLATEQVGFEVWIGMKHVSVIAGFFPVNCYCWKKKYS